MEARVGMTVADRPGLELRTRVYRYSWGQKLFALLILAAGCLGLLRYFSEDPPDDPLQRIFANLLWIGLVLVGVWVVSSAFWSKVTWSPAAISVRTLLETTAMPLDAIAGRREYVTRGSKGTVIRHFVLVPRDNPDEALDFTDRFSFDRDFEAWFSSLPSLSSPDAKPSNPGLI